MKFAVFFVADQTILYLKNVTSDGKVEATVSHSDALLHDTLQDARAAQALTGADDVEDVADEAEFRAREDTW